MGGIDDIIRVREGQRGPDRFGRNVAGCIIWMRDGSVWFHPYSGGAPHKLQRDDGYYPETAELQVEMTRTLMDTAIGDYDG